MTRKKIGIIGAMKSEMDTIKASVKDPKITTISGMDFVEGTLEGAPVVVATSGIGKVFAGICAQTMILEFHPDLIINVGVAGSLSPELNIGDIVIADCVVQHDMDSRGLGDPIGMVSGIEVIEFQCDPETVRQLSESAEKLGFRRKIGMIASGDQFIQSREGKDRILEYFPAVSCEMEGGGIGQVCYVNKIPFCILRAISDNGDENATGDYDYSLEMAADRATQVVNAYLAAQ